MSAVESTHRGIYVNIEITSFDPSRKNTLQGFLAVRLTEPGLEIRDIALH